ncbi:PREDICTED: PHD finger protein 14-like, partial [Leptosomus discolor]|uniref:PHD finger protein 14-like n=1 Tax=Leptosomus discolor TaxID=188344 RepID=UPI000522DC4E
MKTAVAEAGLTAEWRVVPSSGLSTSVLAVAAHGNLFSSTLLRTRGRKRSFVPEEEKPEERIPRERRQRQSVLQKKPKSEDLRTECATCKGTGDNENLVRCDECRLCYHFGCLDPPLKKSPKQTGYGWICQECDSTSSK